MNIAHSITPTQIALYEAAKERAKRMAEAARKMKLESQRGRVVMLMPDPVRMKHVRIEVDADAHVKSYRAWLSEVRSRPIRHYITKRAEELGVTYGDVVGGSLKRHIIGPKHQIIWEVKRRVRPAISYPELAKLFGLTDHTTSRYAVIKMDKVMGWADGG